MRTAHQTNRHPTVIELYNPILQILRTKDVMLLLVFQEFASTRALVISSILSCSTECSLFPSDPSGPPNN